MSGDRIAPSCGQAANPKGTSLWQRGQVGIRPYVQRRLYLIRFAEERVLPRLTVLG